MTKKYEPSAFPNPRWEGWGEPEKGMTLRDYFAAKALQGLLANPDTAGDLREFPRWAYTYADIMLRAREANND